MSSEIISKYLEGIVADKKRDSKRMALQALRERFEFSEIELALSFLINQTLNFKGTNIQSPLAFLTQAMNEVLKASNQDQRKKD